MGLATHERFCSIKGINTENLVSTHAKVTCSAEVFFLGHNPVIFKTFRQGFEVYLLSRFISGRYEVFLFAQGEFFLSFKDKSLSANGTNCPPHKLLHDN